MTLRSTIVGLVVLTMVAANLEWGCQKSLTTDQCNTYCTNLSRCGLLHSPFGTETVGVGAFDNCTARCELSQPSVLNVVDQCLSKHTPRTADWCNSLESRCGEIASCLNERFPNARVLGYTRLAVDLSSTKAPHYRSGEACLSQTAGDSLGVAANVEDAEDWCQKVNAGSAIPFVLQAGKRVALPEIPCSTALAAPAAFAALSPGCARAGFEVMVANTTSDAGDAGTGGRLSCYVFYATAEKDAGSALDFELFAGSETRATVGLPRADSFNQDRQNPKCLYQCEYPPLCSDDEDNDGDGLFDCADPGCNCSSPVDAGTNALRTGADAGDAGSADAVTP